MEFETQTEKETCMVCDHNVSLMGEHGFIWYCTNAYCPRFRNRIKNNESCFDHERGGLKTGGNILGIQRALRQDEKNTYYFD